MLTGHNYIVFLSGKYRGCDFPSHVLPPRNHHKPVCWYSMRRSWIPASLSCVPDVHSALDIPLSPQVQFLFFLSRYLPLHLQILEHDHICMVFFRISYNRTCNLFFQFCVQTFRICPSSLCLRRAMFPLGSADPSQCAVHPVFFTGMIYESSSQDSSVCPHDGTDCIGIDP